MKNLSKLTYKIYLQHAFKYKYTLISIIISVLIASLFNLYAPLLYKDFFNVLADANLAQKSVLISIVIKIFLINIASFIFWRFSAFLTIRFQTKTSADLVNTSFQYLQKHSVNFFSNHFVGSLVKKINRFQSSFSNIYGILVWNTYPTVIKISVIIIVFWYSKPMFGIGVLVWLTIFIFANYIFSKYKLPYDLERSIQDSKATGILADAITNHTSVALFSSHKFEFKRYAKTIDEIRMLRSFTWKISEYFHAFQIFFMTVLEFGIFYIAINYWEQGLLSVGDFVLLQSYLLILFNLLWDFGRNLRDYYENMADAEEMAEIFNTPHEIVDVNRAKKLIVKKGNIIFDNVSFRYKKTRKIFENLSINIEAGERVAFVGHSGAGKSTITKLLLRMFDVTEGDILIDGQKISQVTLDSLRNNISYVPQETILFHRSLLENIRYGKLGATEKEVMKAAKLAHCHQFISNFPDKYQTMVGERGVKLSGGERQRIAIARAILKNAPILVLDEATASLDSESEVLIQKGLDVLMKGKTVIVIAHRLSTIMKMDRIIVMEDGKILEQGSHKELIAQKVGRYKKLWELQAGGFM